MHYLSNHQLRLTEGGADVTHQYTTTNPPPYPGGGPTIYDPEVEVFEF